MKKTLVIGASTNPERFSYKAIHALRNAGYQVAAIGLREGEVKDVKIETDRLPFTDIHTVTLYIGPKNQPEYYPYILSLKPSRVIFNPGTENEPFQQMLRKAGITVVTGCTLVMLSVGNF